MRFQNVLQTRSENYVLLIFLEDIVALFYIIGPGRAVQYLQCFRVSDNTEIEHARGAKLRDWGPVHVQDLSLTNCVKEVTYEFWKCRPSGIVNEFLQNVITLISRI